MADHLANADDLDVGIHLTLNAELESFRWAPSPTHRAFSTATAGSPAPEDLWDHADIDEVRECRAGRAGDQLGGRTNPHHSPLGDAATPSSSTSCSISPSRPSSRSDSNPATPKPPPAFRSAASPPKRACRYRITSGSFGAVLGPSRGRAGRSRPRRHRSRSVPALAAEGSSNRPSAAGRFDDLAVLTDRKLHARLEGLGVTLIGYRAPVTRQRAALSQSKAASAPNATVRTSRRSISQALWSPTLNDPSMNAAPAVVVPSSTPVKASYCRRPRHRDRCPCRRRTR